MSATAEPRTILWFRSPLLLIVIAAAWALAIAAELSGSMQWVHQHQLAMGSSAVWASLALFFLAWQVHIAAMMLPSSLPMIGMFNRAAATQPRAGAARALFLGGYLLIWTAFGLAALLGNALLQLIAARSGGLMQRPELMAGARYWWPERSSSHRSRTAAWTSAVTRRCF